MDDSRLLTDARQGREPAFLELYHRYRTPIFRFAFRMTGSNVSAEDITQECFLALLAGASFDSARGDLRTYLLVKVDILQNPATGEKIYEVWVKHDPTLAAADPKTMELMTADKVEWLMPKKK